jgi:bifunctional UDP-N-acetylglucosamine pyrophosphorylase / glucosamine-1-phosphate N-acetyltransferase
MNDIVALILAAGKGTRMKSKLCKVLHAAAGRSLINYVLDSVQALGAAKIVLIVGHQSQEVISAIELPGVEYAVQEPQLGTGHAVMAARDLLRGCNGHILILCGDIPLIQSETLARFVECHTANNSGITVMTTIMDDPQGYGRIVRDGYGLIRAIVEEKDATPEERLVSEINSGIYLVRGELLFSLLDRIGSDNAQHEYYLTDIVREAVCDGIPVHGFLVEDSREVIGINTRSELAKVSNIIWNSVRESLMKSGVTLLDPSSAYVDSRVKIGQDTIVHPNVTISGLTEIGSDCVIESGVYILDSRLGDGVRVLQGSRLDRAEVQDGTSVGPMAHLRPEAMIGRNAKIGNFVEVKKSVIGDGSKASHLTYLGDSSIGKNVNIGCGTITCNYDGKKKHRTVIHDRCFVGSDVQFVAPVEVGQGSIIGAGSTITRDVPEKSLAVSRTKQKIYPLRKGQGSTEPDENRES